MGRLPGSGHRPPRPARSGEKTFTWLHAVNDAVTEDFNEGSRAFVARYSGTCVCGSRYEPGDRIRYIDRNRIGHEGCEGAETPRDVEAEAEKAMGLGPAQVAKVRANMCPIHFIERTRAGICGECDG